MYPSRTDNCFLLILIIIIIAQMTGCSLVPDIPGPVGIPGI